MHHMLLIYRTLHFSESHSFTKKMHKVLADVLRKLQLKVILLTDAEMWENNYAN